VRETQWHCDQEEWFYRRSGSQFNNRDKASADTAHSTQPLTDLYDLPGLPKFSAHYFLNTMKYEVLTTVCD